MIHDKYFDRAKEVSTWSTYNKFKIGCVAVYRNKIIGIGYNCNKTHPMQKEFNKYRKIKYNNIIKPTMHAEIMCLMSLRHMNINWNKVSLYIYRSCSCNYGMSRPCAACMEAIKEFGVRNIHYTTSDGYAYESIEKIPNKRYCA